MAMVNALPGNSSVNMAQHATIEKAVFSVDLTDVPTDWLDRDHVMFPVMHVRSAGIYVRVQESR
jgi:hypothetical protein